LALMVRTSDEPGVLYALTSRQSPFLAGTRKLSISRA
jgi:hypothetical protein